jgi:hypothetical protein
MAFIQILQLQEVVMEKGQQCKLGERESVTLLLWEISQFNFLYAISKELLDFAIVQNFSQKKKPLVMDTFHNIYYIIKMNHINENHNIDQVNEMHEKNNT